MGALEGTDGQVISLYEISEESLCCCDTVKLSEWGMFTDELM